MPKLLRTTLLMVIATVIFTELQAQNNFWQSAPENSFTTTGEQKRVITPSAFGSYKLDTDAMLQALKTAPTEFTAAAQTNPLILTLPMPDGSTARFAVVYSPIMEPALQERFPDIRTYSGQGIDDKTATLKMDWTEFGFHAQVLSANPSNAFYIDPYARGEKTQYISYHKKDLPAKVYIESEIKEQMNDLSGLANRTTAGICLGTQLRTYRLAVACTHEYATAVGASTVGQALSAVTTTINRVDGIYETEVAIRLTLIANETSILFVTAGSDPFTGNNDATILIGESQTQITNIIGSANFDVGHTFSTGAGGLAGLGVVCNNSNKARGVTGSTSPTGDGYDVDYVAHELGHEFGASHTFNANTSSCGGSNRNAATAVEPGSGVTIMAYAGICGATNDLAAHSIPYFHAISENEIANYSTLSIGSFCGTATNTGNAVPVVNAGSNYTIPVSTPFMLTGSATDANNSEVLTYSWEEIDPGTVGNWNSGNKPYFRPFPPTLSKTRYFPQLSDVMNGTTTIGEILPTTAQTLNFRLTVRDNRANGGGVCSNDMAVTVSNAGGPFSVTSQTTATSWTAGNSATITWNVANTTLAPISTSNVTILFSADGGYTYPYTLLASTANDGTENITIPSIKTTKGRIMVKAVGNIFFNVNTGNITITSSCNAEGAEIAPVTTVSAMYGSAPLNIALTPQYTSPLAASGSLTTSNPSASGSTAIVNITAPACGTTGGVMRYITYPFTVTASGNYTFTHNGPLGTLTNFYTNSFDPANTCTNFLNSNILFNGTGVSAAGSVTVNLSTGVQYVMVVGTYSSTQPTLPSTYNVGVTTSTGGTAYGGTGIFYANPGAGFSYAYVVVNNATGNIVSIGTSNLTNSSTYPIGQYTVYGLSYSSSISTLNTYVGGSLTALLTQIQNNPGTFCASLSKNAVTVNVTGTFPVQFTALKARKQGEKVALDWGTVTEANSSHFVVQRSTNGVEFNAELGRVNAAGNSNSQLNYNFTDVSPVKGWNYYRIKQVDRDGKFIYSNVAAVNFEKGSGLMVIYPNPTKDKLNIEYTSERSGKLELQVIDSKGAVLMSHNMQVTTGRNLETINVSSLSQGMYMLKYIDADGNISFTKFIKQ